MFSRLTRPTRSPLEEANALVLQALSIAGLYKERPLSEVELALLKQLRINLLCGSRCVDEIEKKWRRGVW